MTPPLTKSQERNLVLQYLYPGVDCVNGNAWHGLNLAGLVVLNNLTPKGNDLAKQILARRLAAIGFKGATP